jgi:hypothetical protein
MNVPMKGVLVSVLVALAFAAQAQQNAAPQNVNIRGLVTAFDGKVIAVKSRDGGDVKVDLPENVPVNATKAFTLADIRPGMVLGVTTMKRADGGLFAIDVRPIPPTARQGLSAFDLQPGSTMTNAVMEGAVESTGGQELTLNYQSGAVKVLVPPGTPMSQSVPGHRSDIKPGETVFIAARAEGGDKYTAVRVQVSKDGVKPTQ